MEKRMTTLQANSLLDPDRWSYYPIALILKGERAQEAAGHLGRKFNDDIVKLFFKMTEELQKEFPEIFE